jgi:tetratricopeptide (TPR) repeat protein
MLFAVFLLSLGFQAAPAADPGNHQREASPLPSAPSPKQDLGYARKLIEAGNYKEALKTLGQIKAQSPNTLGLNHELGIVYYRLGDPANAISALRQALVESADDHEAQQLLGMSYFQLGKPAEAIPQLEKIKAVMPPGNVNVAYVLGMCYLEIKEYDKGRQSLAAMYNVSPESPAAYLFTARLLFRQGFDSAAEEHARKAVSLDSRLPLVHFVLGEIALFRAHLQQAREEFEQEIQLNPGYAAAYDRLADAYMREGDLSKPEALLKRSILLDPNSTGSYILLGKFQLKVKDYTQAVIYLEKASRMDPGNFIPHHLLGEAYRNMGKLADAERELKTADEIQSSQHPQIKE